MPNHLASETSPYLLQHANNPVDWYPWGPEALTKAKAENKPIFLSIGYSACHWCHVMEHESFENEAIAIDGSRDVDHFVAVDRSQHIIHGAGHAEVDLGRIAGAVDDANLPRLHAGAAVEVGQRDARVDETTKAERQLPALRKVFETGEPGAHELL